MVPSFSQVKPSLQWVITDQKNVYFNTWVFEPARVLNFFLTYFTNILKHSWSHYLLIFFYLLMYNIHVRQKIKYSVFSIFYFTCLGLFLLEDIYLWLTSHAYKWKSFMDRQQKWICIRYIKIIVSNIWIGRRWARWCLYYVCTFCRC